MEWTILDTGKAAAAKNMEMDAALLKDLKQSQTPVLHFYDWQGPCATYGYFLDPLRWFNEETVRNAGFEIAKRPTGGGIVFHISDFAYSILVPMRHPAYTENTGANYAWVQGIVADAVQEALGGAGSLDLFDQCPNDGPSEARNFCMVSPVRFDVMWNGMKIAGAAQRRTRWGFLHQGTVCLGGRAYGEFHKFLKDPQICDLLGSRKDPCAQGDLGFRNELKRALTKKVLEKV